MASPMMIYWGGGEVGELPNTIPGHGAILALRMHFPLWDVDVIGVS